MRLSIVTSVHRYGQYLADWADSIIQCKRHPVEVVLLEHGGLPDDETAVDRAADLIRLAGIRCSTHHRTGRLDFGEARNLAVAASSGDWVMHLDADDMLLPKALLDIEALADDADVVALGYQRTGDLASGPPHVLKLYRPSTGEGTLRNLTPASGCSPFRKAFWEAAGGYPTDQLGGWDTALWLKFARLGARFVPTSRPGFLYRQHADSVFNTRRKSGWPAAVVGAQLQGRRAGQDGVAIIVPRHADDDRHRQAAWSMVRERYRQLVPTWDVVEGVIAAGQPWCKGAAIAAALEHTMARTLVIADADVIVDVPALRQAVEHVERHFAWAVPHRKVYRLTEKATARCLDDRYGGVTCERTAPQPLEDLTREPYPGFHGGGCLVVSRPVYEAAGGIPRCFEGWGGEDEALGVILDTLVGPHVRIDSPLIHLWHPPQPTKNERHYSKNRQLYRSYRAARGSVESMWGLVARGAGSYLSQVPSTTRPYRQAETRQALAARRTARETIMDARHENKMLPEGYHLTKSRFDSWRAYYAAAKGGLENNDVAAIPGKVTYEQVQRILRDMAAKGHARAGQPHPDDPMRHGGGVIIDRSTQAKNPTDPAT